ncbi:MAG: TlpA family protein disulfide reductase [Flavitalea sp.]
MEKKPVKKPLRIIGNVLFYGLLLLVLLNGDVKSWVLRQLVSVGIFSTSIDKVSENKSALPKAAAFSYRNEKGETVSTESLKGKVVFINFWASWCPPCRAEMPSIYDLYNKFKNDERYVFIFMNEDEDKQKAVNYLKKEGFDMPIMTASGTISSELYSGTLPTTIVLNKKGEVAMKHEGMAKYSSGSFIEDFTELGNQ